jgi:MFS transporter, ACS family, glucarate transporter
METQETQKAVESTSEVLPSGMPVQTRPTHARYWVVALAVTLGIVTYLDRACISTVAPDIRAELGISEKQMARIFSAFMLAYIIFEVPTAWWADRRGTRGVLTRIVVWWSALTIATGMAIGNYSMLAIRFLFGAGEAGAMPSVAATFSRWIPANERGRMQGLFFAGAHLSAGVTPLLVVFLMNNLHNWRWVFVIFGLTGLVWSTVWYLWYRNEPAEHSWVNDAEREYIVSGRRPAPPHEAPWDYWRQLLSHRNMILLCLMYMANCCSSYFCMTWLPTYLKERWQFQGVTMALSAGLPLTLSVFGDLFGGATTDFLNRRFGLRIGRAGLGFAAYVLGALAVFTAATATHATVAIVAISVALIAVMFTLGAAWGTCLDIGGHHAGVVSATMNTVGNFAAFLFPMVAIDLKDAFGTWDAPLYLLGCLFVVGTVCWCFIDPRKRVFD